jgi:hypothetical protein
MLNNLPGLFMNYLDSLAPAVLLILVLVKRIDFRHDYVVHFIAVQFLCNFLASVLGDLLDHDNNLYVYHLNCFVSFVLLSLHFRQVFRNVTYQKATLVILIMFVGFFLLNVSLWEDLFVFNSNSFAVASFLITSYSLMYYLENLTNPPRENMVHSRVFWYTTGLFTYYTCSFFIFITYRRLTQNNISDTAILWRIHNVVFLIMCVHLFIGILCKPLPEK